MPAQERKLDVWIVDLKKVYTGVPFAVVTDWLQQGRLLRTDCVRMTGKEKWHKVETVPALGPYLPKPQPQAAQDRAEALEPIDLGFQSTKVHEGEDDDVDMIPLIDVSLVLLIFFMMTTAISSGVFSAIPTPAAKHQLATISADDYWLGIDLDKEDQVTPRYSLGKDSEKKGYLINTGAGEDVLAELARALADTPGEVRIRLRAHKLLTIETIKGITLDLQELETRLNKARPATIEKLRIVVTGEVSEPTK